MKSLKKKDVYVGSGLQGASDKKQGSKGLLAAIGSVVLAILKGIVFIISTICKAIGKFFIFLWGKSKLAAVALATVLIAFSVFTISGAIDSTHIYKGVKVGNVDVSGMTVKQAQDAISNEYQSKLQNTSVYIFADQETMNSADLNAQIIQDEALAEQLSFEQAQQNKKLWITSASDLQAGIPVEDLSKQALDVGRKTGMFDRIGAMFAGYTIPIRASFDETLFGNLVNDINGTLGQPVTDYGMAIENGKAVVTNGSDGYGVDPSELESKISGLLLNSQNPIESFVADVKNTPFKIDEAKAATTCDLVNNVVSSPVNFEYNGNKYEVPKETILSWIGSSPQQGSDGYYLNPYIIKEIAIPQMVGIIDASHSYSDVGVSFRTDNGNIFVKPDHEIVVPDLNKALTQLDDNLFGPFRSKQKADYQPKNADIKVESYDVENEMPLDQAINYGIVSKFSTYTTTYTNRASTENRNFNIHLAADLIGNSTVKSGEKWSFIETSGPLDESAGFEVAKIIAGGESVDGIGGGICQVATTVFNAVYRAGMTINQRYNHALYNSSYPAGLDAAVSYPDQDLKWTNDSASDVLVMTSYDDTSITVTLVGKDPQRKCEITQGDWVDGKEFTTKFEVDTALPANSSYVKTAGTNGMSITINRVVYDKDGKELFSDSTSSNYSPINRVVCYGEGSDLSAIKQKYATTSSKTG